MNEHVTYYLDGVPHGAAAKWRDITPERRVIGEGVKADAPPPEREVVPAAPRRGRPRKAEGDHAMDRFLAACERTAVDGVIVMFALCDALKLEPATVGCYASRARKLGRFPYRFAGSPWRQQIDRGGRPQRKGGAA